jgi:hypothetical protein
MVGTMASSSISKLTHEFDSFLYASVGEDTNGMPLSVLSALARADLDPWLEAARLAGAPGKIATERLASLIIAVPGRSSTLLNPGTIAARLVALLPRRATALPDPGTFASRLAALLPDRCAPNTTLGKAPPGPSTKTNIQTVVFVIFMVLTLGIQWAVMSNQAPAKTDSIAAPDSSTASADTPAPRAGRGQANNAQVEPSDMTHHE